MATEYKLSYTGAQIDEKLGKISQLETGKVDKNSLTLGLHTDGKCYIFVDGAPVGTGFELSGGSGDVFGYVDENNNIVLNGNLANGTYSIKYETDDGTIDIGDLELNADVYYSVTNSLTNCTNSNSATQVIEGASYEATITANSGYSLSSVTVTMGGTDISSTAVNGGVITIASVTGNIVITASAQETVITPSYTNVLPLAVDTDGSPYNGGKGYKSGYKMSCSSGGESATTGAYCTGFIPINDIYDEIYIKGITLHSNASVNNVVCYDANKTKVYGAAGTAGAFSAAVVVDGDVYHFSASEWTATPCAFVRISCGGITDDTIITVNEEIV